MSTEIGPPVKRAEWKCFRYLHVWCALLMEYKQRVQAREVLTETMMEVLNVLDVFQLSQCRWFHRSKSESSLIVPLAYSGNLQNE